MISDTARQFGELLQQQTEGAKQLHQTLQDEKEALVNRDTDAVQRLSQEKDIEGTHLEQLSQQQRELLESEGLPYSSEGIMGFIEKLPPNLAAPLRKKQLLLQTLLEKCQNANLVNGNIIAANKHSAETALAILRGQFTSDNLVYSAGGQAVNATSSKPPLKA